MLHLSELHGAATHLAVVAIPLFAILYALRRADLGGTTVEHAEPIALAAGVIGVAAAGVTGLLVWGQAQTTLRGHAFRLGTWHLWLGILTALLVAIPGVAHGIARARGTRHPAPKLFGAIAALAVLAVGAQGWIGGRMTYEHGVGIDSGGQLAQTAIGAEELNLALAQGRSEMLAGREAFSREGLGCASCHGDRAEGMRGPRLAGGVELDRFRHVHGTGLFPEKIVTDRDFAAINAWLRTLNR